MTEYQIPVTLPEIRRRYAEIAPNAVTAGTPEPAAALARWLTFAAARGFTRMVNPDVPLDRGEVNALCVQFGMLRLLAEVSGDRLADADRLAADILGHWEDGGSMGEWLWAYAQSLGIDANEIVALAAAEAGIEHARLPNGAPAGQSQDGTVPATSPAAPKPAGIGAFRVFATEDGELRLPCPAADTIGCRYMPAVGDSNDRGDFTATLAQLMRAACEHTGLAAGKAHAELAVATGETAECPDNDGNPVIHSAAVAPGGWVCAVPAPDGPDWICGHPVESEPCPEHRRPGWTPE